MSAIDSLSNDFKDKLKQKPESEDLRHALEHLTQLRAVPHEGLNALESAFDKVRVDLEKLEEEGLWERSPENERLLQDLVYEVFRSSSIQAASSSRSVSNDFLGSSASIQHHQEVAMPVAPPLSAPLLPFSAISKTLIPVELVDALNQTYFLHTLAVEPDKVLPPGKSLLSAMTRAETQAPEDPTASIREKVESLVHRAFWDEALESLSNPAPAVELPRLKRLYEDLHTALVSLLPPIHPVLETLSSPLSPTSAPLQSAAGHLREILVALRERCAPVHDAFIDDLLAKLGDYVPLDLPQVIVGTVRDILKLTEQMKEDLSQFVLGSMGEKQLRAVVTSQAVTREKELIYSLWEPEKVPSLWKEWLAQVDPSVISLLKTPLGTKLWIAWVMQALGTPAAVSCNIPTRLGEIQSSGEIRPAEEGSPQPISSSALPPPFFFVTPSLVYIQNYLQALVIVASLRSLIRLPPSASKDAEAEPAEQTFTRRVWTILRAEIDGIADDTRLVHLADEIIRTRRSFGGSVDEQEEKRLRAAVDRTLRTTDPVFTLLSKRLVNALTERLLEPPELQPTPPAGLHLHAGRAPRHKHPEPNCTVLLNIVRGKDVEKERVEEKPLVVKGFEEPVLVDAVTEVVTKLRVNLEWVQEVWDDLIKNNTVSV